MPFLAFVENVTNLKTGSLKKKKKNFGEHVS